MLMKLVRLSQCRLKDVEYGICLKHVLSEAFERRVDLCPSWLSKEGGSL